MLYLTLRQYEYVTAVAHHGSLSAAAEAVHVSQPALSAALTRIEAHLGYPLFLRRRGAALSLTPQGRDFARRARELLDQAGRLENADQSDSGAQSLSLGCFADLAPFLLAPALKALRETLPGISVTYRPAPFEVLIQDLLRGETDLAITYDLGLDAGFHRSELDRIRPHALVPDGHPLLGQESVSLSDLIHHPLILSQEGLSAQHMLSLFRSLGLLPRVAHRAASLELLRSLAANGEGVGISYSLPPVTTSYDGLPLHALPISDPQAVEPVVLVSHAEAPKGTVLKDAQECLQAHLARHKQEQTG